MTHLGAATVVRVEGRPYTLSRYTRALLRQFAAWADAYLGDPFDHLAPVVLDLPELVQVEALRQAELVRKGRRTAYSEQTTALWVTPAGQAFVLGLLLRKHHAELTPEAVEGLWADGCAEHGPEVWLAAMVDCTGRMPPDEAEQERDYYRELGLLPVVPDSDNARQPVDWFTIDLSLMKQYKLRPWEIDELTVTEILVLFRAVAATDERQTDSYGAVERAQLFHKLTAEQRFELYRRTAN